ncbi:MAG: pilus assembly protein [Acidobacteria bacterium]|nr:pilus assembly protein [Acidobacteriota bacterium]
MRKRVRGNAVLEVALWMPVLMLLVSGMIQFGRITYLNYVLQKIVYTAARSLAVGQNLNFCDPADPATQAAIANALNDPATGLPVVSDLTSDMLVVTTQCFDANGVLGACDVSGCDGLTGAQRPDFVTVAISGGYAVQLRLPFIQFDPVQLKPSITVPFGGTKL